MDNNTQYIVKATSASGDSRVIAKGTSSDGGATIDVRLEPFVIVTSTDKATIKIERYNELAAPK